jgi:hypothetical protein
MLRRLKKLGINKTDPAELTPEEVRGSVTVCDTCLSVYSGSAEKAQSHTCTKLRGCVMV